MAAKLIRRDSLCRARRGRAGSPNICLYLGLTLTFLTCYSLNLVLSELYIEDSFTFLVVKAIYSNMSMTLLCPDLSETTRINLIPSAH